MDQALLLAAVENIGNDHIQDDPYHHDQSIAIRGVHLSMEAFPQTGSQCNPT